MTIYEALSVIGAFTGTSVLFWDVYKLKTKHTNVSIEVAINMPFLFKTTKSDDDSIWVTLTITNLGDNPVTLTSVTMSYYATKVMQFRKKAKTPIKYYSLYASLPRKILQGEQWIFKDFLNSELEEMARKGILVFNIHIAGRKRPKRARIKIQ